MRCSQNQTYTVFSCDIAGFIPFSACDYTHARCFPSCLEIVENTSFVGEEINVGLIDWMLPPAWKYWLQCCCNGKIYIEHPMNTLTTTIYQYYFLILQFIFQCKSLLACETLVLLNPAAGSEAWHSVNHSVRWNFEPDMKKEPYRKSLG